MNRTFQRTLLLGMTLALIGTGILGCSSTQQQTSKEDAASFKGGPMPPEARKKMEEAIQAARNKTAPPHPQ